MTDYLAQIVTRAKASGDSNPIRPAVRHWYATEPGVSTDSLQSDIAPFDSGLRPAMPEPLSATREIRSQDRKVINDHPKHLYDSLQNRTKGVFSQDEFSLRPYLPKESSSSHHIDTPADRVLDKKGESKSAKSVDPASFETNLNPLQSHARKPPSMSRANKMEVSEGEATPIEPAGRSSKVILQPEFTPKNAQEIERISPKNSSSIPELQPTAPTPALPSAANTAKSNEPRLVIGRLKVEVVTAPPVKTQQVAVRTVPRRVKTPSEAGKRMGQSKLLFGLGQL